MADPKHFAKTRADFVMGVAKLDQLPGMDMPEYAFAGRSNVGKSSLINALTGRKQLARSSVTPGRTQQLNFFNIDDHFYLVDMPGYGYAKASKKDIAEWNHLLREYLIGRANLKRVFMLIDSRRGIMPVDIEMMNMLDETAVSYQLVVTKIDKLKKGELDTVLADINEKAAKHPACFPGLIITSAEKGDGMDELRAAFTLD